jgi:hypothetical protein
LDSFPGSDDDEEDGSNLEDFYDPEDLSQVFFKSQYPVF